MKELLVKTVLLMMGDFEKAGRTRKYLGSIFLKTFPGQMTCREFESFIADYLEGALSERQRKLFDWHMAICPMCKVHFETYCSAIKLSKASFDEADADAPSDAPKELINAILAARRSR